MNSSHISRRRIAGNATPLFAILLVSLTQIAATPAQPPPTIRDGTYAVNQQIAPGTYRSTGKGSGCYWERTGEGGDILANHFGLTGGIVTIQAADVSFSSRRCGPWVAIDLNNKVAAPPEKQTAPHKDGFYLVGVDIAPGVWRSTGQGASCYWARQNLTQDLIDNDLGFAGGAVTIQPSDVEFYAKDCGTWVMLDTNNKPALPLAQQQAAKRDGQYIIGLNMAPGRWRSNGQGTRCYWEKSTVTNEIIDNHLGVASVIVEIAPTDFQFEARGCGVWVLADGVGAPINSAAAVAPPAQGGSAACPVPNVCILAPANGTRVARGSIVVFSGTAGGAGFVRYQFLAGNGQGWGHIADFNQPVTNGDLMELHTDTLPPGTYTIRMQVIDNTGNALPQKADITLTIA